MTLDSTAVFFNDGGIEKVLYEQGGGSGGGVADFQWAIVLQIPEYNEITKNKYVVQKAVESSTTVNGWEGDGNDIEIDRALGFEGYPEDAKDIRNWNPWYEIGSIVKIVQRFDNETSEEKWFLDMPLMYTGPETTASLRHDVTNNHIEAVWT
jgi:hypothetical protein